MIYHINSFGLYRSISSRIFGRPLCVLFILSSEIRAALPGRLNNISVHAVSFAGRGVYGSCHLLPLTQLVSSFACLQNPSTLLFNFVTIYKIIRDVEEHIDQINLQESTTTMPIKYCIKRCKDFRIRVS